MEASGEGRRGADRTSGAGRRKARRLRRWISYGSILLLQLKLIWGVWSFRDLSTGDTASYYALAGLFRDGLGVDILWSPLYTAFFGCVRLIARDAYAATTLHRVAILLLLSVLVLAVARRVLTEPVAWAVAAWWVILPVHFNALYEVHLFAVLPVLGAWLAALRWPGRAGRGACLALLLAATLLVRNELLVATAVYAVACLSLELVEARRGGPGGSRPSVRDLAFAYGLPLALAAAVAVVFYARSVVKWPLVAAELEAKHTISTCQPYAFGWRQRHPEWTGDPWTGSAGLMTAHFGEPTPTLPRMLASAPARVAEHVLWNLRLTPAGLQLLLFNVMSGPASPDYSWHNPRHPVLAWGATVLLSLVWGAGLAVSRRTRTRVFEQRLLSGWLAMAAVAATALLVIPTQRPRPAYLFAAGLFLALLTGRLLDVVLSRWRVASRPGFAAGAAAVMLLAPVVAPRYHETAGHHDTERPRKKAVERLGPFRELVGRPGAVTIASGAGWELEGYVGAGFSPTHRAASLEDVCPAGTADLRACVERAGGTLLYLDEPALARYGSAEPNAAFLASPERYGWTRVAPARGAEAAWLLLSREPAGDGRGRR